MIKYSIFGENLEKSNFLKYFSLELMPPWQCIRSGILMIPIPARRIEAMPSMPSMRDCYLHHVSSVEKKRIKALIFFFRVNLHFTSKSVWGLDSMKWLQTFLCLKFPYYCSKHSMSALLGDQRSGIKGETFFSWAAQPERDPQHAVLSSWTGLTSTGI